MTYYEIFKEALNILYLLCAPAVAIFAYKALSQIKVTRAIAQTQAKRESFRISSEQCVFWADTVVPQMEKVERLNKQGKLKDLMKVQVTEEQKSFHIDAKDGPNWHKEYLANQMPIVGLMNNLESFSIFLTNGIADEKVAFRPIAPSFCETTKRLLPIILLQNSNLKIFSNTLILYMIWRDRLKMEKLKEQEEKMKEEIKKTEIRDIKPIGTDNNA
jgi:hypothetical protein